MPISVHNLSALTITPILNVPQLEDGMKLERISQPHPTWSLTRCAFALYGATKNRRAYMSCYASWDESLKTLREFVALEQLGDYEWKQEAEYVLENWKDYQDEDDKYAREASDWCSFPFSTSSPTMASLGACACLSPVLVSVLFNWDDIFS